MQTLDRRLSRDFLAAFERPENRFFVSAVTAFELTDLQQRGRLPVEEDVAVLQGAFLFDLTALPADLWTRASKLPHIHGDPVDRMLVAHALHAGFAVATADRRIHQYEVPIVW